MNARPILEELTKLGFVSEEEAHRSLQRLDQLERDKPSLGQVGRYAGLGAAAGLGTAALKDAVKGDKVFKPAPGKGRLRAAAAPAVAGSISMGGIPLIRRHLDRQVEMNKLKQYMQENNAPVEPHLAPPKAL